MKNQSNQKKYINQGADNLPKGDAMSLPNGWEMKKLGEVCDLSAGGDVPKNNFSEIETEEFNIPIYANGEKYNGLYGYTNIAKISKPSITVSARGTIGFSVKRIEPFFPIVRLIVITPKNEQLDLSYLNYGISKINFKHSGTSIPQLTVPMIKNYEIPVPPLAEQQRIVAYLDQTFAKLNQAKANTLQNLQNAKELFETELRNVFENKGEGWEEKTLAQISKTFGRGKSKHRPRNWDGLYGGNYPFIQTGDIRNCDHYITEYSQTYNDVGLAQSKLWKKGTICITIAANIAETGILTFDACFPDSIIGIEVNEKFADRDFVEYLLQFFKVRIQALGKGAAQANINMGTFENELFPFPKVTEQQTIVAKLDALKTQTKQLESVYQTKLNNIEELRNGILKRAFETQLIEA